MNILNVKESDSRGEPQKLLEEPIRDGAASIRDMIFRGALPEGTRFVSTMSPSTVLVR